MPDPETSWLDEAEDVTDAPEWTSEALEVKETVPKEISAAERARSGLPVFGGDTDPSAPREELTEDFVARDRVEGGRARGRVLELAPTDISVDPHTGDSAISVPDASEAREAVLYEPSEDVIARTPGISRARDDSVSLRGGARFEGLPGLASALQYAEGLVPDARYSPGAMATGASEMLTLGHTDEIAGGIRGAQGPGTYEEERDRARAEMAERAAEQPGSTLMGMGAGLGLMALVPGAREAAAARGGGAAARIGAAVGEGTVLGAAAGSGASEAELGSPEHLRDTSTGGVIGGAASGAMQSAGEVVGGALRRGFDPDDLLEDASMLRVRGMFGGERPPRRTLRETFGSHRGRGERVRGLVAEMRALGVRNADDAPRIQERAGEALDDVASRIDAASSGAPAGLREPNATTHTVDAERIAARIREHAQRLRTERGVDDAVVSAMEREAQRWEQAAQQSPMTFRRAWQFRQEMGRPQYWTVGPRGEMNPAQAFRRDLYSIVREELDDAASRASPELAQAWRRNSRTYSILSPFVEAAEEARFRGIQNRQVSLTDSMGAMAGYTAGGAGGAVAGGLINRGVRAYEHTVKASAMERLADIVRRHPGQLGPYGTMLQNALNRGPGTFSAAWYLLARQHPELQQRVQDIDDPDSAPSGAGEY